MKLFRFICLVSGAFFAILFRLFDAAVSNLEHVRLDENFEPISEFNIQHSLSFIISFLIYILIGFLAGLFFYYIVFLFLRVKRMYSELCSLRSRFKELEIENARLKKIYAEERSKAEILKEAIEKKG